MWEYGLDKDRWRALVNLLVLKMQGISWLAENRTPLLIIYITINIARHADWLPQLCLGVVFTINRFTRGYVTMLQ